MLETALTGAALRTQQFARFKRRQQLAVSIDFSVWPNWRDAVRVLLQHSRHITRVGVSAGSPDWTFFRGPRSVDWRSGTQRAQAGDLLEIAVNELGDREICTTALLDARAPRYLRKYPKDAAVDLRGQLSAEIVCSTAMAEGEYGRFLVEAFEALCASTRADSVAVTNLQFSRHCFCALCLARFHGYAWRSDWPRLPNGAIELLNPLIGKWRSTQVAGIVARLSAFAHAHGKRMLFEAHLSRDDPGRNGRENGQDYGILRPHVDEFVIRDDLGVDDAGSSDSSVVARHLSQAIGAGEYWHCIGLQGCDGLGIEAQPMRHALIAALRGGARRLWITPSHSLSPSHWQQLDELMKEDYAAAIAVG